MTTLSSPIADVPDAVWDRLRDYVQRGEFVLFLGAGASLDSGAPTARTLSDEIGERYFGFEKGAYPLDEIVALVDAEAGRRNLNAWLTQRFASLKPSATLQLLPTFSWRAIYTTNFDTLVEQAYATVGDPVQKVHPIYSDRDPLSYVKSDEVALYKLHGCLSRANSADGRLVLTQDDFAAVEQQRARLFNRLLDHAADCPILYVGFRRADPDFARTLADVDRAVGALTDLPRSYALQPEFHAVEAKRAELKKVTLVDTTAAGLFGPLDVALDRDLRRCGGPTTESIQALSRLQLRKPFAEGELLERLRPDFEILDDVLAEEDPNIEAFFEGSIPTWGVIAAGVDAQRDLQDAILEAVLVDDEFDRAPPKLFLLQAEAGAGKTTLLRRIGAELQRTWDRVVLNLRPFGSVEFLDLEALVRAIDERVYVLIDDLVRVANDLRTVLARAQAVGLRLTFIGEARTNEWLQSQEALPVPVAEDFELTALSNEEIDRVLDTLESNDELNALGALTRDQQRDAFVSRADKQLLVALREATEGGAFDDIIVNEYEQIATEDAKRAYLYVAALHRFNLVTRAPVLHRALGVPLAELGERVFVPATKIIVPREAARDPEPYYTTRHPLIAEILFDRVVRAEAERLDYYLALIGELDLGYKSDADTYRRISRSLNTQLLADFTSPVHQRELMAEITSVDPTDAYVHQHSAMMELAFGDIRRAAQHIAKAIELRPDDRTIRDTEGRIVLASAVREKDRAKREARFADAESIFSRNIAARPGEPYGYRHLAETYWEWYRATDDHERATGYLGMAYRTLLDGLDNCTSTAMLLQYRAELEARLGSREEALETIGAAIGQRPSDVPLRIMAARLMLTTGKRDDAIAILRGGLELQPDAWELHYRLAMILAGGSDSDRAEIRQHFVAALLAPLRRYRPRLTYAAWLFSVGEYEAASEQFDKLGTLEVPAQEKYEVRTYDFLAKRQAGRVVRLSITSGDVEFDQGAARVFFRLLPVRPSARKEIRVGTEIAYRVGFNLLGPVAQDIAIA